MFYFILHINKYLTILHWLYFMERNILWNLCPVCFISFSVINTAFIQFCRGPLSVSSSSQLTPRRGVRGMPGQESNPACCTSSLRATTWAFGLILTVSSGKLEQIFDEKTTQFAFWTLLTSPLSATKAIISFNHHLPFLFVCQAVALPI